MIKTTFFIVLVLLTVVAQLPAQTTGSNTNQPATGTISGKIVNENGQPMPGAATLIRAINSGVTARTTVTDTEGNFSVSGLEPGLYTVAANAPAYTSIPSDPTAPPTYYRIGDSVRLELVRGGVITGTVTNALGEPVVAVRVRATMVRDARGMAPRMLAFGLAERETDDRGIYRMYGLPPGTYLVSSGGFGASQSFQFNPFESDLPTYAPSSTRDNAAEVSVRGGEETNVDIRYRGEPGHTISGTARIAGTNGASILITPVGGSGMPSGNTFQPPGGRGFAFHGIADGEYDLLAQQTTTSPGSMNPIWSMSEPKRVTVKGASVTGIELIPKPLAKISGRIVLEESKIPECRGKRPPLLAETVVHIRRNEKDADKHSPYLRLFGGTGAPDSKGEFILRNVSPGRYQFQPRFYARYWYLQSMTLSSAPAGATAKPSKIDVAATWTTVKNGDQLTNLTITLAEGAASVRGRLTAAAPTEGALVYLLPAEPAKAEDVLRFFVSGIGADGAFALNNVPPGKYWVFVQATADEQTATLTRLRQPEAAASRAKLRRSAEAKKLEIELKPCQNLMDYELKH